LLPVVENHEFDDEDDLGTARPNVTTFTDEDLNKVMRSVRARLGWVIAVLLVLLIFLMLKA